MAKRKVNLSELVRAALSKGITKPAEVVASIREEHGVAVKPGLVHNVKSAMGKMKPRGEPGRKPGPKPRTVAVSRNGAGTLTVADITTMKNLLSRLGKSGIHELVTALS
jgi:hypothetical protein